MKTTLRIVSLVALYLLLSIGPRVSPTVSAAASTPAGSGSSCVNGASGFCGDPAANPKANCSTNGCDFIQKYVNPGINLLSVSFGLIAVVSITIGGVQYSASAGDPQKAAAAKKRITNTIIALICYFFLYGFLQFLIPGGIFH